MDQKTLGNLMRSQGFLFLMKRSCSTLRSFSQKNYTTPYFALMEAGVWPSYIDRAVSSSCCIISFSWKKSLSCFRLSYSHQFWSYPPYSFLSSFSYYSRLFPLYSTYAIQALSPLLFPSFFTLVKFQCLPSSMPGANSSSSFL